MKGSARRGGEPSPSEEVPEKRAVLISGSPCPRPDMQTGKLGKRGGFKILYIHEGQDGLKDTIEKEAAEFGIAASVTNLIPDKLLKRTTANMMKEKVESRVFDIIVLRPPAGTFSRARWSNGQGPRPVRSAAFLRGFPTLTKMRRKSADSANAIVDWMVEAIAIQKSVGGDFVLDHPEDLGHIRRGTPGSIWRWATVSALLDDHVRYGALCQGDYGASSAKPSRMMTSMATVATLLEPGPPRWTNYGFYLSPLRRTSKSSSKNNRQRIADVQDQANCGVAKHFDFSDGESDAGNTF